MNRRADLSTNWRLKSEHSADSSIHQAPHNEHDRPNRIHSRPNDKFQNVAKPNMNTVRGEDDPRTLQAIAQGRRVYVGNMPYMAKLEDVKGLFADGEYLMSASLQWPQ